MDELTAYQRDLLVVIAGLDSPMGLEVNNELKEYYETEIGSGSLYPNLNTLAEKGLVVKGQQDHRTNTYEITDRGKQKIITFLNWQLSNVPTEIKSNINETTPKTEAH